MKTQGEIEAAICAGISRFEQETRGRGPNDTGAQLVSLHHDISTVTGEAFIIFTLAESPLYRQAKK